MRAPVMRMSRATSAERATTTRRLIVIAALLLIPGIILAIVVRGHPAPLPGDVGAELAVQQALLSRGPLTAIVEGVSTINFPVPSALRVTTVAALLMVRRWLGLLVTLLVVALADGSSAIIKGLV